MPTHRRKLLLVLACVMGLLPLLLLSSLTVTAEGGKAPPPTPTPGKNATPAPTPKPVPHGPQFTPSVDLNGTTYSVRGAHSNENATYTAVLFNSGTLTTSHTEARLSIPSNTTYVNGSATLQGGGALTVTAGVIQWGGKLGASGRVTITFVTKLPGPIGTPVTSTLDVAEPMLAIQLQHVVRLNIQPNALGPDAYGYTVKDSFAPGGPTFAYVPKTVTATSLFVNGDDDHVSGILPVGFTFLLYTQPYTQFSANSNGVVSFITATTSNSTAPIPSPDLPNAYATCAWSDFIINNNAQNVWYQTFGNAPNRTLVIHYLLADFGVQGDAPAHAFQMILFEGSNRIKCQYADTSWIINGSGGQSAIGVENADGSVGLSYFRNAAYSEGEFEQTAGPLENGMALLFQPGPSSLPVFATSSITQTYSVHPNDTTVYTITLHNSGNANANAASLNNPIPAGATYFPGSAAVVGGGVVNGNASAVTWNGSVNVSQSVTVTFKITNPNTLGTPVNNVATINDSAAAIPVQVQTHFVTLPPRVGGPDAYGYTFRDSYAPAGPTYNFIAPTITATRLFTYNDDDVYTGPVPLNFNFAFYGGTFSSAYVSSNGMVSFNAGDTSNVNEPLPSPNPQHTNFAACDWTDLIPKDATQGAWMQTFGAPPNRTTIISWREAVFGLDITAPVSMQMVLFETSNRIVCQYADNGHTIGGSGSRATIGMQNADGSVGLQYFYSNDEFDHIIGPIEKGLALAFLPDNTAHPAFTKSAKSVSSGTHPGEVVTYTMRVVNNGLLAAANAHLDDPIPAGAEYVPGSLAVVGGGSAGGSSAGITWNGPLAVNAAITITYRATLTALSGTVFNTAVISAPAAAIATIITAATHIQPYIGHAVGPEKDYFYADSYAPNGPTFTWVPTTVAFTRFFPVTATQLLSGPIALGYGFKYFGRTYTEVVVGTNGLVTFNYAGNTEQNNWPLLQPNVANNYATCLWDKLSSVASGGVYLLTQNSGGNHRTIITFVEETELLTATTPLIFQMILRENEQSITCQYLNMNGEPAGDGRSASIGIENGLANSGLQYYFGTDDGWPRGPIENNLAIEFKPYLKTYLPLVAR